MLAAVATEIINQLSEGYMRLDTPMSIYNTTYIGRHLMCQLVRKPRYARLHTVYIIVINILSSFTDLYIISPIFCISVMNMNKMKS